MCRFTSLQPVVCGGPMRTRGLRRLSSRLRRLCRPRSGFLSGFSSRLVDQLSHRIRRRHPLAEPVLHALHLEANFRWVARGVINSDVFNKPPVASTAGVGYYDPIERSLFRSSPSQSHLYRHVFGPISCALLGPPAGNACIGPYGNIVLCITDERKVLLSPEHHGEHRGCTHDLRVGKPTWGATPCQALSKIGFFAAQTPPRAIRADQSAIHMRISAQDQ